MSNTLLGFAAQIMVMAILLSVVLLFIGIGILVLIHVCIVGRAFRRGFSTMVRGERCNDASNGLSPGDLEKLPCYNFNLGEKGSSPIDCAVCLESFQMGDKCRFLPECKHSFHVQCVDSWLLKTPICPICRTSVDHLVGENDTENQLSHFNAGVGLDIRESQPVVTGFPLSIDQSPFHASTSA